MPRLLDFLGHLGTGGKLTIDLVGVVGVVPQCRIDQRSATSISSAARDRR